MAADMKIYLLKLKATQEERRKQMGRGYHTGDYVCCHEDGTPYRPSYITNQFQHILKIEGLPRIRFHDLRHTAASLLIEKGVMLVQISKFLGHEKISTTADIYGHLSAEGKKETVNAMGKILKVNTR